MPNLPKMATNESDRVREKHKDEQDKTKLSQLTSRLNNRYLWMIHYELLWQLLGIFLSKWTGSGVFL